MSELVSRIHDDPGSYVGPESDILSFFIVFLSSSRRISGYYFTLGYCRSFSMSFSIYHSLIILSSDGI
jgi:hypothetical protein